MDVNSIFRKGTLIFDGAMGTMLLSLGLKGGDLPEVLNITERSSIIKIHKSYIDAGANVISANTFGANERNLANCGFTVERIIDAAVNNAREAAQGSDTFIALDIGPIGELLEPAGELTFEEAYNIFKRQVIQGVKSGVDLILIETMADLSEARAAVLAAKENSNLPVFCTMSFKQGGRTYMGCSAASMTVTLQGLGVDALGINCSLGPQEIEPIVDEVLRLSRVPVMVQPNAGLPVIKDGKTVYNVTPEEFADYGLKFAQKGVKILGGCCGTNDTFIKKLSEALKDVVVSENPYEAISCVCTPKSFLPIDGVKIIGERINPTGKRLLKESLAKGDMDYIQREASSQIKEGADILDVNVGISEINQEEMIARVIRTIQSTRHVPLQIDSFNPRVIEAGLRAYNGKAIVNSVNGSEKVLDRILPLVKKYGAAVVGLTFDENGMPKTAEERLEIAEKIIRKTREYGIPDEDVIIDCLAPAAASDQEHVGGTARAIALVKEKLGVKTTIGISNVSFKLPNRELLNRTFLAACLSSGLDLPILNTGDKAMLDIVRAYNVLWNRDEGAKKYLKFYGDSQDK